MVERLAAVHHGIPGLGQRGQPLGENAAVAAQAGARIDAVQDIRTARLRQGADEIGVAHVSGRLLPVPLLQIGDDVRDQQRAVFRRDQAGA